ncbi:Aminoglycoside phosphotransferase [Penicillium brevicompactum]|uniref:Aminoglycoside phosphotransferase n=1 Tax=Penicillium brevicompactum TaxID=5074 RepID=A0A9W9U7B9_PENBR|nr:Aminoglycoside phosphotransferase [Penicillium brevicompactum]
MQVARNAGLLFPRVICYGAHPDTPHTPVSILMTRVPGEELGRVYEVYSDEDRNSVLEELRAYLEIMRVWPSLWGDQRICSLPGTSIRSVHAPGHFSGPFESEDDLSEYLVRPAWSGGKITGFLDWESAGWYPEYWDFTTALKLTQEDSWWHSFVVELDDESYLAELGRS